MPPPTREDLWSSGKDETVEVNQRALIDKILARYSGEHTIFRELLQNADDAGAQHVQVKFYTQAGVDAHERAGASSTLPDVKKDVMVRWVVTNDGIPFRPQDWQRLKKIAEGNPDEKLVGAFGVGFYSLFSVCDDPFVQSGDKWMGFYWKDGGDQLFARSGDMPPSQSQTTEPSTSGNPWTSFTMTQREPTLLEGPLDLARFFVTSMSFTRTIRKVDMLVDDFKVLEVSKSVNPKTAVGRKGLRDTSTNGMMKVVGVDKTGMIITAKVMKWLSATGFTPPPLPPPVPVYSKPTKALASIFSSSFFNRASSTPAPVEPPPPPPPPEDPLQTTVLHREIELFQAEVKVTVSPAFGRELERATKKPPPARMPVSLVFSRADDAEATIDSGEGKVAKDVGGVFSGLSPPLDGDKSAKVFIGQATGQTTGIGGHLSARFIPTVERESIDLVDRHVSHWNRELLWVGGYLSRMIYELELLDLQAQWTKTSVSDPAIRSKISAKGLHALRFFTFRPTTPSAVVGQEMESAFFLCASDNKTFPIVSSAGILPVRDVRMPNAELQKFLPDLPVLTSATIEEAARPIARLRERSLLREVTLDDVIKHLGARPLSESEMIVALQWWQSLANSDGYNPAVRSRLLDAAVLVMDNGKIVPLSMMQTVVRPQSSSIPTDMPLPPHTLPYTITRDLKGASLYPVFGWTELSLLQYITFLINPPMSNAAEADGETDVRTSPAFAERVLAMLGRAWQSVSANQQSAIALELKDVPCIPTKAGFKKPGEAYFEKNLLFDDLPTIALPNTKQIKGGMEKMLLAIGVRRTVDLQLVFSRLVGGGTWSCQDLMKYLVSVKDTLTNEELARLRQTAAFPLEQPPMEDGSKLPLVRRKPHELYEPTDAMRSLGLPLLDWGEGKWKSNSEEAKMILTLGLRRFPPIDVLLGIAAGRPPTNEKALRYLLAHISTQYPTFDPNAFSGVAFIPATAPDGKSLLAKPGEVFSNWACAILGFAVADPSIINAENAAKLRIPTDPPTESLVTALLSQVTKDVDLARRIFEYMATRVGQSGTLALGRLQNAPFIPARTEKEGRLFKPSDVYFSSKDGNDELFRTAFTFIDFGDKANVFLKYCGVRSEPSVKDIALLLMRSPERMLEQAGSPEKYLDQLRLLAANWTKFDISTRTAMKAAPFLLASRVVPVKRAGKKLLAGLSGGMADEEYEHHWVLCKASEAARVDDIILMQYFGQRVLAAPEEQLLEEFYEHLGANRLSSLVRVEYIPHGTSPTPSSAAAALRQHVLERLTIFLAEARRRPSEYTVEWLSNGDNFTVSEVRSLQARYTLRYAGSESQHSETLYATANKKGKSIVLTVSTTATPDDYDIAHALCHILLKSHKADDALLLNSILSTPLMALKKRGYNVDRILNRQREDRLRLRAEAVRDREKAIEQEAQTRQSQSQSTGQVQDQPPPAYDDGRRRSSVSVSGKSAAGASTDSSESRKLGLLERLRKGKSSRNLDQTEGGWDEGKKGILAELERLKAAGIERDANGRIHGMDGPSGGPSTGGGFAGTRPAVHTARPSDLANIRSTVQRALDASRPETGTQISDSRQAVTNVPESQDSYCDTTAQANLILAVAGGPDSMAIWIPRDTADWAEFLKDKLVICESFTKGVIAPLGSVFRLSNAVFNVFWDNDGPLIAFNRGGAIFCNARYFAAWHHASIQRGERSDALISWYFSIAHELAHNLESAHNSSHEFYFSSIAEEYLTRLMPMLRAGERW